MNQHKSLVVTGVIISSIFGGVLIDQSSAAVTDLGDVCITFSYNVGFPPMTHRYGLLAYGASQQHILLTSTGRPESGFAVLAGDTIIVTLEDTAVASDASTIGVSTSQIIFSAATLSGPLTTITRSLLPGSQTTKLTGTATVVPCS